MFSCNISVSPMRFRHLILPGEICCQSLVVCKCREYALGLTVKEFNQGQASWQASRIADVHTFQIRSAETKSCSDFCLYLVQGKHDGEIQLKTCLLSEPQSRTLQGFERMDASYTPNTL